MVSLEQEIIRFKPRKRRIKGEGEDDGGEKRWWGFVQRGKGKGGL